jgi:non-homologous end joining protein Ku
MNCRRDKSKTSSRFVGVYLHKLSGKWSARIRYRGIRKYLGVFVNEIDAARAYDKAAKKYHREFARLNFPEGAEAK